ncbi:MAG TPA: hypothetical protein ENJ52_13765 [Aliiroseovarius sp.]|nr:hypothetical protein [Aliiroseovarius sp.]
MVSTDDRLGSDAPAIVPVLDRGILWPEHKLDIREIHVRQASGRPLACRETGVGRALMLDPLPDSDVTLELPGCRPLEFQVGGIAGQIEQSGGGRVSGWARNQRMPDQDLVVVAFDEHGVVVARAIARAAEQGAFRLILPASVTRAPLPRVLRLGVAGSDCILEGGPVRPARRAFSQPARALRRAATRPLAIRIKISSPDLNAAPLWGDYHFANSLARALERLGHAVSVDPVDSWYAQSAPEDVSIVLRGRHGYRVNPDKINIMWLISHPDRVPDTEYADYDHIAVASQIYAERLEALAPGRVSVLHQATDAALFGKADTGGTRRPVALFVGNSRGEYRTMVKWCLQAGIALDLYGGGWGGIVAPKLVRAPSVANADLPALYAAHQLVLNDHWYSMRINGFLSNRLFDASATGTPVITDAVSCLSDVFGDTVTVAEDQDSFVSLVRQCLADPAPWLERAARARQIVLNAHTFDHRAESLNDLIERLVFRRRI